MDNDMTFASIKMIFLYGIPVLLASLYAAINIPPTQWAKGTKGGLIGEILVHNRNDAHLHASAFVEEAFAIWSEPASNWEVTHDASDLVVEIRRITSGPFAASGIHLTRANGVVPNANPDEVYDFLTSEEGLLMLDPNMDPDEIANNIETYPWKGHGKGSHLDVHESFMHAVPPMMEERYYIVLNGYDIKDRFFFCKSIVHDARPGSSIYYEGVAVETDDPRVRALNTFYFRMTPTEDGTGTMVQMINYVDLRMGSTMMNWLLGKAFYPGVFGGLKEKFAKTP